MTRENLSVGRLLNTQITPRMSKIEFDNADYIESCMVFKNFTSLDGGRSREFVAKFNHPDEAKDFIKNYNQIYNDHEAQLKAKDEEIKELGEIIQQYLIPSKNYDAIIKAKDDEIRRLNNLYADTIKDLGDALIEIERLKADIIKASYADGKLRKLAQVVDKPLDQALKRLDSNFTK